MKKIPDNSLNHDIYEHYSQYYHSRGVGIISDNQFVFYTQVSLDDGFNHDTAMPTLDNMMYPGKKYDGWYISCDDIVIASITDTVIINLPKSGTLTIKQYEMLKYFTSEINEVIKDFPQNKINITVCNNFDYSNKSSDDIEEIMNYLDKLYLEAKNRNIPYTNYYKEEIVGLTCEDVMNLAVNKPKERQLEQQKAYQKRLEDTNEIICKINNLKELILEDKRSEVQKLFNSISNKVYILIKKIKNLEELENLSNKISLSFDISNPIQSKINRYLMEDIEHRKEYILRLEEQNKVM